MAQLQSTTVTGTLNVSSTANILGTITANATPLTNTVTRVQTGLAMTLAANAQTAVTLAGGNTAQTTNAFSMTFNEVGMYSIEGLLILGGNISSANASNIGINVAFFNSGTATFNYVGISHVGYCNSVQVGSTQLLGKAQTTISLANGNTSNVSLSNAVGTNSAVDFISINGVVNVSAVGTGNVAICSKNTANGNLIIMSNSFLNITKIG